MRVVVVLVVLLTACGEPLKLAPGGNNTQCGSNADCAAPFSCVDGCCGLEDANDLCQLGKKRCNGDSVEICVSKDPGDARDCHDRLLIKPVNTWVLDATCASGCRNAACVTLACLPGARRCDGNESVACLSDGSGWAPGAACSGTCDAATGACAP